MHRRLLPVDLDNRTGPSPNTHADLTRAPSTRMFARCYFLNGAFDRLGSIYQVKAPQRSKSHAPSVFHPSARTSFSGNSASPGALFISTLVCVPQPHREETLATARETGAPPTGASLRSPQLAGGHNGLEPH